MWKGRAVSEKDPYIARKEKALMTDLETAFSGYERLVRQVNLVRAWTVAIMVAALGWIVSREASTPHLVLYPASAALFAFLILELRERSSMRFNKSEVLKVQNILMIEDLVKYETELRAYKFRDLRLAELSRADKLGHLVDSAFNPQVFVWYGFWILVLGFAMLMWA
jgi:hypothetical protein